jgi:nucleoside-diphosphate-sugar epimerase
MEYEVKNLLGSNLYADIFSITEGSTDFSRFSGKTILITGAAQLVGMYAAISLLINNDINNAGSKVIAVDSDESIFEVYGKLTQRTDIDFIVSTDYSALSGVKADYLLHTERLMNLECETALINLVSFIMRENCPALINTYSDIYGDVYNGNDKLFETDMGYVNPVKPEYKSAQSQRMAESLVLKLLADRDVKISRSPLIDGAADFSFDSKHIDIIREAIKAHNLVVGCDDHMPESYCYVTDAVEAMFTILLKGKSGEIYNIASPYISSTALIAHHCVKLFPDRELKIITKGTPKYVSPISPTIRVLDNTKLSELGYTPKTSISKGIEKTASILLEVM